MKNHEFLIEVAKALAGCQAVELELKLYITHALEKAARIIDNRVTFRFSGDDYREASLERLIEVFKKTCSNDDLAKHLAQFKTKRNFLAHKAIANCMTEDGNLDELATAGAYSDLNTIQRDSEALVEAIAKEHQKLFTIMRNIPLPPNAAKRQF
jgi:hypothetical protein